MVGGVSWRVVGGFSGIDQLVERLDIFGLGINREIDVFHLIGLEM